MPFAGFPFSGMMPQSNANQNAMTPQANINPNTGLFSLSPQSRRQNLFQAMIPAGLGLIAASGPSTDPGAFSKGLAATGQNLFTNTNALNQQGLQNRVLDFKMRQLQAENQRKANERRRLELYSQTFPQGSQQRAAIMAGQPLPPQQNKFGSPYVLADPNSSTGYSRFQITQGGDTRKLGEAPIPASIQYTPFVATPQRPPGGDAGTETGARLGRMGLPIPPSPFEGADRKTAAQMMIAERNKFTTSLDKRRGDLRSQENMIKRLDRFGSLMDQGMGTGFERAGMMGTAISAFDDATREAKSIEDEITPLMRQGMPGAASDRDVAMFRGATVGISKPEQTNRNIIQARKELFQLQQERLEFDQEYFSQNQHTSGADRAWREYTEANPIFDPKAPEADYVLNERRLSYRDWFRIGSVPDGVKAQEWRLMTPAQRKAFRK
tara:strand:+ start:52 stop:1365 length:1314 start_codon:yes stop_codon:yes gene_type:complete